MSTPPDRWPWANTLTKVSYSPGWNQISAKSPLAWSSNTVLLRNDVGAAINGGVSTDATFASASDERLASQKATKDYVDGGLAPFIGPSRWEFGPAAIEGFLANILSAQFVTVAGDTVLRVGQTPNFFNITNVTATGQTTLATTAGNMSLDTVGGNINVASSTKLKVNNTTAMTFGTAPDAALRSSGAIAGWKGFIAGWNYPYTIQGGNQQGRLFNAFGAPAGTPNGDTLVVSWNLAIDPTGVTYSADNAAFRSAALSVGQSTIAMYTSNDISGGWVAPSLLWKVARQGIATPTYTRMTEQHDAANYVNFDLDNGGMLTIAPSGGAAMITSTLDVMSATAPQLVASFDLGHRFMVSVDAAGKASLACTAHEISTGVDEIVKVTNNTPATSTSTGSLVLTNGGLGVNKEIWGAGITSIHDISPQLKVAYDDTNHVTIGCDATGKVTIDATGDEVNFAATDAVKVLCATQSTSTSTGGLILSGGLGVAKNIYAGGNIYSNSTLLVPNIISESTSYTFQGPWGANTYALTTYIQKVGGAVTWTIPLCDHATSNPATPITTTAALTAAYRPAANTSVNILLINNSNYTGGRCTITSAGAVTIMVLDGGSWSGNGGIAEQATATWTV